MSYLSENLETFMYIHLPQLARWYKTNLIYIDGSKYPNMLLALFIQFFSIIYLLLFPPNETYHFPQYHLCHK